MRANHTQITLNRLSARNVRTMVGKVAAQTALSDETIAAVVERTSLAELSVEVPFIKKPSLRPHAQALIQAMTGRNLVPMGVVVKFRIGHLESE
jgi:hypothetical protein